MTDLEIAQKARLLPITKIAAKLGIQRNQLHLYGNHIAKLPLDLIDEQKIKESNLILVSAISPTPAGEGKTTVSIGLSEGLNQIGKATTVVLREPSLGPVFGIKGGATGGGYSQVLPMEEINLHFTGDFSAVERAHNLLAALLDNNLQSKTRSLGIDARTVTWKRVMDMNDRSLRKMVTGLGGRTMGIPRESGFDITAASEIMAILCLSQDLDDLKKRMGNILVGYTRDGQPVYARDLNAQGAMAALMKFAIRPNLVQTLEGNPAIIHGGPFANIAQGTNTIIATKTGLSLSEYVVTEAGFGMDLGGEKFLDIKCRIGGLSPKAVVLVVTTRALKYHGGMPLKELTTPNVKALKKGFANMDKHLQTIGYFGIEPVVAINRFATDSREELDAIVSYLDKKGIRAAVADGWAKGGKGMKDLARQVVKAVKATKKEFKPLYKTTASIEKKIETIAKKAYGAKGVEYSSAAKKKLKEISKLGMDDALVCIAKTQKSLSDNAKRTGRPKGFTITVRDIEINAGAGFVVPITGNIMRMPGLPAVPAAEQIDIDQKGNITGLF